MTYENHLSLPEIRDYEDGFATVTICGSMRYFSIMLRAADVASREGWLVYMPFVACEETEESLKTMLDQMHFAKIRASYAVIVVGEHIGESTQREIEYARANGKNVFRFNARVGRVELWT